MQVVDFVREKYGRELLIDAGWVSSWPWFEQEGRPHALAFHDLLLVTAGSGVLRLDTETLTVKPGVVVVTRPGQIRQWTVGGVEGACIFFADEFVSRVFSDPRFLETFAYFRQDRPVGAFRLGAAGVSAYLRRFRLMQREIRQLRADTSHKLRAALYDVLVQLDRSYQRQTGAPNPLPDAFLSRFLALIERRFRTDHRVSSYARSLGVTPGHLTVRCRQTLGRSAGQVIRDRIVLEATRQLTYGDQPVARVGAQLGFEDPSYFTRFLTRETGRSPSAFRQR